MRAREGGIGLILDDAPMDAPQYRTDGAQTDEGPAKKGDQPEQAAAAAEAVEALRDYLSGLPSELKFDYDEETGRQVFKVVNPVTREVVKQYPPEEFLSMVKRLKELAKNADGYGMLFDDRY